MRYAAVALILIAARCDSGQSRQPLETGRHTVVLRGTRQYIYYLPARNLPRGALNAAILFAPGRNGWRGWAREIGDNMAGWGHDVFAIDTKRYLGSARSILTEREISADFEAFGRWAQQGLDRKLILVGWSEGAGLGVLAAGPPENQKMFQGIVACRMPSRTPGRPASGIAPLLSQLPPVPLYMIHSTNDGSRSLESAKHLFASAREPKMLKIINARDGDFGGNRDGFLQALREGIEWVAKQNPR